MFSILKLLFLLDEPIGKVVVMIISDSEMSGDNETNEHL